MTLQEQFLQNHGAPLLIEGRVVLQIDRIPIKRGKLRIEFRGNYSGSGIALKSKNGGLELSDGEWVPLLHIWDEPGLPRVAEHRVDCQDGELRIWNVYKNTHPGGRITTDCWTGNAGMIIEDVGRNVRRYKCSNGTGVFNPQFEFEITWK